MKKFLAPLLAIGFLQTKVQSQSLDQQYNEQYKSLQNLQAHCLNIRKQSQYKIKLFNAMLYFKADGTVDRTSTAYGRCVLEVNIYTLGRETRFGDGGRCRKLVKLEENTLYEYRTCEGDGSVRKEHLIDLVRIR